MGSKTVANHQTLAEPNEDLVVERTDLTLEALEALAVEMEQIDRADVAEGPTRDSTLPYAVPPGFLLSIVVPVFNEEQTIRNVIQSLYDLPLPVEVIAVDDGSTDTTAAVLTKLNEDYPQLRVCIQECNQGKGAALRRGFAWATGDYVMVQDADLEYDPVDIPSLLEPVVRGQADVVYGSRFLEQRWQGSSAIHRWGNWVLTMCSNWATGWKLTDMETCYKVIRRDLLQDMKLEQNRFGFEVELTAKLARKSVRLVERPISYNARTWEEGKKIGWKDALQALYCIARYSVSFTDRGLQA